VVLTPWAACQDPAQLRQLDPQVGSDAITVAYIDNGVARGATLLIEMYLTGCRCAGPRPSRRKKVSINKLLEVV
jgi:hypothetical protein